MISKPSLCTNRRVLWLTKEQSLQTGRHCVHDMWTVTVQTGGHYNITDKWTIKLEGIVTDKWTVTANWRTFWLTNELSLCQLEGIMTDKWTVIVCRLDSIMTLTSELSLQTGRHCVHDMWTVTANWRTLWLTNELSLCQLEGIMTDKWTIIVCRLDSIMTLTSELSLQTGRHCVHDMWTVTANWKTLWLPTCSRTRHVQPGLFRVS